MPNGATRSHLSAFHFDDFEGLEHEVEFVK